LLLAKKFLSSSAITGAAFLMATSAIGPGFITQTTKFTNELLASFGFVILISLLLDIIIQLNIWRIVGTSNQYAPVVANTVFPGAGVVLTVLITIGSLVFNIANVAGAGLGLQALTGCSVQTGAAISAAIAIIVFLIKHAGKAMDWFAKILGFVMIALTLYVAWQSQPPLLLAIKKTINPDTINKTIILTIVGGTVGGYISFAGIHRLLDAGVVKNNAIREINRSAVSGIVIATVMRTVLFLAVLGVVMRNVVLDANNPAATVFQYAVGNIGMRIFGLILWSAAITSVVGSAFTSVSFLKAISKKINNNSNIFIILFIAASAILFMLIGKPVTLLVFGGAVNGLILPVALALMLLAAAKKSNSHYKHPLWLHISGWLVVAVMVWMSIKAIGDFLQQL
jgi:Mn2+/Fe2+ NRAMP family transporter